MPGVDAVGVDRELDRRPVRPDLVRAAEPVEAAANGDQTPERLDGEIDGGLVAVDAPARGATALSSLLMMVIAPTSS